MIYAYEMMIGVYSYYVLAEIFLSFPGSYSSQARADLYGHKASEARSNAFLYEYYFGYAGIFLTGIQAAFFINPLTWLVAMFFQIPMTAFNFVGAIINTITIAGWNGDWANDFKADFKYTA
jgi:hypothetical protein